MSSDAALRRSRLRWLPVAAFVLLAIVRASSWGILHDEGVTYDIAMYHLELRERVPPAAQLRSLADELDSATPDRFGDFAAVLMSDRNIHPPAYYVFYYFWTQAFGTSELALRIPGIAVGAAAVFGMFLLVEVFTRSRVAAFWASLMLAVSPTYIGFSIYLRPYGWEIAIAILSCLALWRWQETGEDRSALRPIAAFTLLGIAGVYTIHHYLFVLIFQFGFLAAVAWRCPRRSLRADLVSAFACGLCIVLAYLPWVPHLRATLASPRSRPGIYEGFLNLAELPEELYDLGVQLAMGYLLNWREIAFGILLAGFVAIAWRALAARGDAPGDRFRRRQVAFVACFALYPLAMVLADAFRGTHTFLIWKTSIVLLPLGVLLVAFCVSRLQRTALQHLAFALCTLAILAATLENAIDPISRNRREQAVLIDHLRENDRPDHVVLLSSLYRGHTLAALVHWKNRGVGDVRIAYGPRRALGEIVGALAADPDVRQISLVNLGVSYGAETIWSDDEVAAVIDSAGGSGTRVEHFPHKSFYTKHVGR